MIFLDRHKLLGLRETAAWLTGRRRRVRVAGDSMLPTLTDGQFVLVDASRSPDVGQLAVANHPTRPDLLVVKRVTAIVEDGGVELGSDNPAAGTDSRTWGPLAPDRIVGTVTLLLDRPSADLGAP